jgi:hypothetical protein
MRLGLQFGIEFGAECCTLLPLSAVAWPVILGRCSGPHPDEIAPTNDNHSQFERIAKGRFLVREDETLAKVDCREFTRQHPAAHSAYELAGASVGRPRVSRKGHSQAESHRMRRTDWTTIPGRHSLRNYVSLNLLIPSGKRESMSHPMIRELRTQGMSHGCKGRALFTGI